MEGINCPPEGQGQGNQGVSGGGPCPWRNRGFRSTSPNVGQTSSPPGTEPRSWSGRSELSGVMNIQGKPGEENLGPAPGLPEFIAWGSRKEAANGKGKPAVSPLPRKSSGPRVAPRIALSSGEASPDKGTPPKPPPAIPGARKTGHLEARFRHSRPAPC